MVIINNVHVAVLCLHYILQVDTCRSAGTKQELPVTPYIMEVRVNEKLGEKYTPKMGRSDCGVSESAEEIVTETGLPVCTIGNDQEVSIIILSEYTIVFVDKVF